MQQPVQIVPNVQSLRSVQNVLRVNTNDLVSRDDGWSEAIAVGSLAFVENVKNKLGAKAMHRDVIEVDENYALREPAELYAGNFSGKNEALSSENSILWDENLESANT